MRNAALQTAVFNAGGAHHIFKGRVAVSTQSDQLLHIALKSRVVAFSQKLQPPDPLVHVKFGPEQQRCVVAKHPFEGLQRSVAVGPGLAVAD